MRLLTRLGATGVLAALPLVAGASWFRAHQAWQAEEDRIVAIAMERLAAGELERLEADPASYPGPGRPRGRSWPGSRGRSDHQGTRTGERPWERRGPDPEWHGPDQERRGTDSERRRPDHSARLDILAYRANYLSDNTNVPPIPDELLESLEKGAERASLEQERDLQYVFHVATRTPWPEGPGAVLLLTQRRLSPMPRARDFLASGLLVGGLVLAVSLLAAGPLVGRLRRLTRSIERDVEIDPAAPIDPEHMHGRDEVAELAHSLDRSRAQLRRVREELSLREQTLRRFVENTTHDVAIPLSVLQGHLAEIARRDGSDLSLTGAMEEAHYVASILRNLGTVARLEAGEQAIERGSVDLAAVVERSVARHKPIARQAGISLESSTPESEVLMEGNVTLLEEALSNLIHNALRYNHEGGHVAAVLGLSSGGGFWLRVSDDGPGIAAEELDSLTARAGRSDAARQRHPDGRGLGLHIVLDVAQRHDLDVRFGSSDGGGLEVTLTPKAGTDSTAG